MRIVRLAIDVPIFETFDYICNEESLNALPQAGDLVKVEFGK
jgi:primosomal protein N'